MKPINSSKNNLNSSKNKLKLSLDCMSTFGIFFPGLMYYSWDPQVQKNANFALKLGPMVLFTHLKIILLQCFSNKRYPNKP